MCKDCFLHRHRSTSPLADIKVLWTSTIHISIDAFERIEQVALHDYSFARHEQQVALLHRW